MSGNGDERERQSLERIEARQERQGEQINELQATLRAFMDQVLEFQGLARRDLDLLAKQQRNLHRLFEARFELLESGLQATISETVRFELSNARTLVGADVDRLRGEVDALQQEVEALARRTGG